MDIKAWPGTDAPRFKRLYEQEWSGKDLATEAYLLWQGERNPAGPTTWVCAVEQEEMVGIYGLQPFAARCKGEPLRLALMVDILVHKDFRGRGISTQLTQAGKTLMQEAGLPMSIGFPNANSLPLFVRRVGYTELARMPLWIKPLRPFSAFFSKLAGRHQREQDLLERQDVQEWDKNWDPLADHLASRHGMVGERRRENLWWRFRDHPHRMYHLISVGDPVGAYAVLRIVAMSGWRNGVLVDFVAQDVEAGLTCLEQVIHTCRQHQAHQLLTIAFAHTVENALLHKKGFWLCPKFFTPHPLAFIGHLHGDRGNAEWLDATNWFITWGDYDAF